MEPMFTPSAILYKNDCLKKKASINKFIALKHNSLGSLHEIILDHYDDKCFFDENVLNQLNFYKLFAVKKGGSTTYL